MTNHDAAHCFVLMIKLQQDKKDLTSVKVDSLDRDGRRVYCKMVFKPPVDGTGPVLVLKVDGDIAKVFS